MKKVIERLQDPIFVYASNWGNKVRLRIGEPRRGETRYALLSPAEARLVAYALLSEAEREEERVRQLNREARALSKAS